MDGLRLIQLHPNRHAAVFHLVNLGEYAVGRAIDLPFVGLHCIYGEGQC